MRIQPFNALRPPPDKAALVASPPYDVLSLSEARALGRDNPLSMLHVVRAEIDIAPGADPYSDAVYTKAAGSLEHLQRQGALVRDPTPGLYIYRQQSGDHVQHGIAALCHTDDYNAGLIKKHERTRPEKEDDRTRLIRRLNAQPGPVFLVYRDDEWISAAVCAEAQEEPLFDFAAEDGVRHTGWRAHAGDELVEAFRRVPGFYIADGHHRAAAAARVARERAQANPHHRGDEDYNWFLCVLFPAGELRILAYNRLVRDLNGMTAQEFQARLGPVAAPAVPPVAAQASVPAESAGMYLAGRWYTLELKPVPGADPVARLEVQLLQDRVLGPLLGIEDPRTSERIEFAGGVRGTEYLEQQVNSGQAEVAFSLPSVTVNQLMEIADAGRIMPPKSTWFEPKLRSGLFVHAF